MYFKVINSICDDRLLQRSPMDQLNTATGVHEKVKKWTEIEKIKN